MCLALAIYTALFADDVACATQPCSPCCLYLCKTALLIHRSLIDILSFLLVGPWAPDRAPHWAPRHLVHRTCGPDGRAVTVVGEPPDLHLHSSAQFPSTDGPCSCAGCRALPAGGASRTSPPPQVHGSLSWARPADRQNYSFIKLHHLVRSMSIFSKRASSSPGAAGCLAEGGPAPPAGVTAARGCA